MASTARNSVSEDTYPKLLLRNAKIFADRPAIREKDLGIWQTWNWSQVLDEVRALAVGLSDLGLKRGDRVAIVGDNRPRLYWTFCAAQSIGAIPIPVYQDSVAEEMTYVLEHAGVRFAIVENQEQVDKMFEIGEKYKGIDHIIYDKPRGLERYDEAHLHNMNDVQAKGRELLKQSGKEQWWLDEVGKGSGDDTAVMLYTSGTTGQPKGVVLTMSGTLWASEVANKFDNLTEKEETIAYLPMAWVGDHIFSYGQSYVAGYCVNCPENVETVMSDRREIGSTYAFAPPRIYEDIITQTMVRMADAGGWKRKMVDYFLDVAKEHGEDILEGRPVSMMGRLKYMLGDLLVYAPLKNHYGISKVRVAYTAGEAIGPEVFRFYRSMGIRLKQLYGQTEASVYITSQPDSEVLLDTVGKPLDGVEIKIDENGEVLYRSPGVFKEYYKNKAATDEAKTKDGWARSGDAGFLDENGHLKIIDRAKDVGKLNDGTIFPPKYIENKLKFFPNVKEAVAFGNGRDYVTCFVNIDLTSVGSWAERNNVNYASYQELASHPDLYKMIAEHVGEVNRELASEEKFANCQIKRFLVLHKELDPDDGEITRTAKVRRSLVSERYAPLVEALYDPKKTEQEIATEVTFEDGRKGQIKATVKIEDMQANQASMPVKEAAE